MVCEPSSPNPTSLSPAEADRRLRGCLLRYYMQIKDYPTSALMDLTTLLSFEIKTRILYRGLSLEKVRE